MWIVGVEKYGLGQSQPKVSCVELCKLTYPHPYMGSGARPEVHKGHYSCVVTSACFMVIELEIACIAYGKWQGLIIIKFINDN